MAQLFRWHNEKTSDFLYHDMVGVSYKLARSLATEWDTRAILDFLNFLSKFFILGQSRLNTTTILD